MASSIMHLAIAKQILNQINVSDNNRFYIGSILPDATVNHSTSHYNLKLNNSKKTMDSLSFYKQFTESLPYDGLYLGYYFHLIQDVIFRNVLFYDLNLLKYRGDNNFIDELHTDYWILNCYLVRKYELVNNLSVPNKFEKERLFTVAEFELGSFLNSCTQQFYIETEKKTKHFSQQIADSHIAQCVEICLSEYNSLKQGDSLFQPEDYAWDINKQKY